MRATSALQFIPPAPVESGGSPRFYRALLDALPGHIALLDDSGRIVEVNAAWRRFAETEGFREMNGGVGFNYLEICEGATGISAEQAAEASRGIQRVLSGEAGQFALEYPCHAPHQKRWFRMMASPLRQGERIGAVVMHIDITDQKQAEVETRSMAAQLAEQAMLLDRAHDAILVKDWEGRIVYWNRSAEQLHGWTAEEVMGRRAEEFLYAHPEQLLKVREALLDRGDWGGELVKKTKDGRDLNVLTSFTLLRDAGRRPDRILAINTDMTERKKLESQLLRSQRMESIGTLAGGIAHDLNNILGPILMALHLLKDRTDDPSTRDLVELLGTSAQRGADIVRHILTFARGAEGRKAVVEPKHLIQEMERFARETFLQQVRIVARYSRDCPPVLGDPTQLHQVLLNLCVNARDAMPHGGVLTIEAESVSLDENYASMAEDAKPGRYVVLSVTDTGAGIPKELQEKIFDPFFTTKGVGNGTGLGLATVAAIVKGHGGFIHLESEIGRGTSFRIYLPAHTGKETQPSQTDDDSHPTGNGELILVVDDELAVRQIAVRTLEKFGYRAIAAGDGAEALAIYAQRHKEIAAVVTDMRMPVLDGVATIHTLRRMNPEVKILAAGGLPTDAQFRAAVNAGAVEFLAKPYNATALLRTLQRVLRH